MNWHAADFFKQLTDESRLARELGARFCRVSGLEGLQDCLANYRSAGCIVAVSDIEQGRMALNNTPHTTSMKAVYIALRHPVDDMIRRQAALDNARELFRQFASRLLLERTRLEENNIYIDPDISFNEINRYFFSGMACAYFQISVTSYCSLEFNPDEWLQPPTHNP